MKDKLKGLLIGLTIGSMVTGVTAFAAAGTSIQVLLKKIDLYVDGAKTKSADAFIYKGTTYVPVRPLSESIGKQVSLQDNKLYIGKQPAAAISEEQALILVYQKIKKDADKYHLHMMIDSADDNEYSIHVFENFPDHIATYGWFSVNKTTSKVYKMDMITGENKEL
ncbi:stalk domain-containing protein [Paenibacillus azoreducens]|uniref:stalk domain-containing protein n=1 Tax=Paenibacillus azoreducens TaxID=116718 RepID=UPI0039F5F0E6